MLDWKIESKNLIRGKSGKYYLRKFFRVTVQESEKVQRISLRYHKSFRFHPNISVKKVSRKDMPRKTIGKSFETEDFKNHEEDREKSDNFVIQETFILGD